MDKKKIINIAAVVIGGIIAYKLISNKSGGNNNSGGNGGGGNGGGGNGGGGNGGGGNGGGGNGGGNVDSSYYLTLANDLFDCFDGYGTKNQKVYDTFSKLKNNNDFDEVVKAYGVREVSSGFGNIFVPNYNGNLIGAIKNEMKSSQIQKINDILKGNGISKKIV